MKAGFGKAARVHQSVKQPEIPTSPVRPHRTPHRARRRILFWSALILGIVAIGTFIAGEVILHRAGPMLKAEVVETLTNRFDCRVELEQFHVSVVRGFEVYGTGLRMYPRHLDGAKPLFRVEKFSFHVFNWRQLFHTPIFIDKVLVTGLDIDVPPKFERASAMPRMHSAAPGGDLKILVGEILINRASLVVENGNPEKVPLHFVIDRVRLQSVGAGRPMHFRARLINPKPIGNIDSSGDFGPFQEESPGDTPVSGSYTFSHADLNTIRGLGGILSSTGNYKGQLNQITVDGQTDTPNFSLDTASHPMPLKTKFHAIVDGTNGNTWLQPVDAWLQHTHIIASGDVTRAVGAPGREIRLDVTVGPGRIQDLLQLAVKTEPPLLTGPVTLHTKLDLPPGDQRVTDKLRLSGYFSLEDTRFTNSKIQAKVDELSLRGQGKADQAHQLSDAMKSGKPPANMPEIASGMRGNFTFSNDKLGIPTLNYQVPGAKIALSGVYTLDGQTFDFHGTARLDAHVSQMVTGWKSWLLKPVDPFFAKDGAGTEVPIQITGTRSEPHIGLDFHH